MQIIPEESPVGESQSNGKVESAIKQVQGQYRTMRLSVQSNYRQVILDNHIAAVWLVPHRAQTLNKYLLGQNGKTARQRLRGRVFKTPLVEYGDPTGCPRNRRHRRRCHRNRIRKFHRGRLRVVLAVILVFEVGRFSTIRTYFLRKPFSRRDNIFRVL